MQTSETSEFMFDAVPIFHFRGRKEAIFSGDFTFYGQ